MVDRVTHSPEDTITNSDPGDETSRRYRFQWTWAAIECCRLLDNTEDIEEIYCEHHEDVLVKHKTGLYSGIQIKTRNDDQPVWKASDEAIINSFVRFACLEAKFPGQFHSFQFLTNHPIYKGKTGASLTFILNEVEKTDSLENLPRKIITWLDRIAQRANVDTIIVYQTIAKTGVNNNLPKLRDITMRLGNTIAQCWDAAEQCSYEILMRVTNNLIDECGRASSLDHEQLMAAYLLNSFDADENTKRIIEGKRMTYSRVVSILEHGMDYTAPLWSDSAQDIELGGGSTKLLHEKLDNSWIFDCIT